MTAFPPVRDASYFKTHPTHVLASDPDRPSDAPPTERSSLPCWQAIRIIVMTQRAMWAVFFPCTASVGRVWLVSLCIIIIINNSNNTRSSFVRINSAGRVHRANHCPTRWMHSWPRVNPTLAAAATIIIITSTRKFAALSVVSAVQEVWQRDVVLPRIGSIHRSTVLTMERAAILTLRRRLLPIPPIAVSLKPLHHRHINYQHIWHLQEQYP